MKVADRWFERHAQWLRPARLLQSTIPFSEPCHGLEPPRE